MQTRALLAQHPDLVGLYNIGGSTSGIGQALKEAGRDNYNHNLETSRGHFETICTTHDYADRVPTLRLLQGPPLRHYQRHPRQALRPQRTSPRVLWEEIKDQFPPAGMRPIKRKRKG